MKNLHFQYYFQKNVLVIRKREKLNYLLLNISMLDFYIIVEDFLQILNTYSLHNLYFSDSINIALKKIQGQSITPSQIKSDVNKLRSLVCQEQACLFLRQIPGTPPYWQMFMYEVIAMVKQLGIPTYGS